MLKQAHETEVEFRKRLLLTKRNIDANGCWLWTGSLTDGGYGYSSVNYKRKLVHITSYELFKGPVPEGLRLDHLCPKLFNLTDKAARRFIRRCFNPDHLEPVTHGENIRRGAAQTTHCPKGHEYTPENTYRQKSGTKGRHCIECDRIAHRKGGE